MTSTDSKPKSKDDQKAGADTKAQAVDSGLIKRLWRYVRPFRWFLLLALVLTLLVTFLGPLRPYITQVAVDDYITPGDMEGLIWIIGVYITVLIFETLFMIAMTYTTRWVGQNTLYDLRTAVFNKINNLHTSYFDKNPIGRLITRTTSDIEALSELLSSGVVNIIGDLFRIVFIMGFMLSMSVELSLVTFLTIPVLVYATLWFKAKVRVAFLDVRDQIARLHSFIQEHINGMSVVQLFNRQEKEAERFDQVNESHKKAYVKTIFYFSVFWPLVEVLASVAMALVVWYGGAQLLAGDVTFGILLAFVQYVRQFFMPIRDLSEKFNTLQSALAASERIFSVMDEPNQIQDPPEPVKPAHRNGEIEFENVWFRYNENEDYVIKDLNMKIAPGEVAAIVGATGAGKTTIINLVTRFYDIQHGSIKVDGVDIRDMELKELRERFALVMQDHALFSGTVMENITLGNPKISHDSVKEAARMIEADQFIQKLPGGYDYELRERGASLSMGQRQLICFVRAMVYDPDILILDEATSNVDTETEQLITQSLNHLMQQRTCIVIAHRLSTIRHADSIIVMHKGRIRERGTHNDLLLVDDGIYKKLYEMQYREQALTTEAGK